MFAGRRAELSVLNNLYNSDKFEFAVMYGRRRVGKTALLNEFTKDKAHFFFTGTEDNAAANLRSLSRAVCTGENADGMVFESMQNALQHAFDRAKDRRLVLVLDEYPYAARADRSLNSVLQMLIDRNMDTSKLMIILCGSSVSYMESDVLSYKAPLFGRKTAQLRVQPMSFMEARALLTGFSIYDQVILYGMVGGTPHYLRQLSPDMTVGENVRRTFLNPASVIFDEPENLLRQEVREPAVYNSILRTVAEGATRLNDITTKLNMASGTAAGYIRSLTELKLIKRESPYGEESSRRSLYSLADNLFRFWYRFVPQNMAAIEHDRADAVYRRIAPHIAHYTGPVFEDVCRQYLWESLRDNRCPVDFVDLGRWWGTDPRTRKQIEFDLIGDDGRGKAIVGECKWTDAPVGSSILTELMSRSSVFPHPEKHYVLFGKNGFTSGCIHLAENFPNVTLISLADMYGTA